MFRFTTISIDPNSLQHNLNHIRELAPKSKIVAMIKSNAYQHGIVRVAHALESADAFGVACFEEAMTLRQAQIKNPIVSMSGFFSAIELAAAVDWDVEVVIHDPWQIESLEKARLNKPIKVWLKINTGMNRLGIFPEQFLKCYDRLMNCPQVSKPLRIMTHFSDADQPDLPKTQQQIDLFFETVKGKEGQYSLANSAGLLAFPNSHADWIRPGIALYGVSPFTDRSAHELGLKPVMTFRSRISTFRWQKKGDPIGYGSASTCRHNTLIGIVPVGYGDGYPRPSSCKIPVLVNETLCYTIGRVSMDMMAIDVTPITHKVKMGDWVTLWGEGLPVEKVAQAVKRIPYELLCGLTRRVHGVE